MSLYVKIILILFGLAYLVSPMDIIPDLLIPYLGWLDDGIVVGTIFYLIRTGKLPGFIFKPKNSRSQDTGKDSSTKQNFTNPKFKNKSPYDILGIHPGASKNQIKKAYKEAIKKYHPDKLSHLGKEFSDLANEKFLKVQKAYDELMKIK